MIWLFIAVFIVSLFVLTTRHAILQAKVAKLDNYMDTVRRLLSEMYLTNDDRESIGLPLLKTSPDALWLASKTDAETNTQTSTQTSTEAKIDLTNLSQNGYRSETLPVCDNHEWSSLFISTPRFGRNEDLLGEFDNHGYFRRCLRCGHRQMRDDSSYNMHKPDVQSSYQWYDD